MSHTPGEWRVTKGYRGSITVRDASGAPIAEVWRTGEQRDEGDARLIATAPDLLAACIAAADMLDVAEFPEGAATVALVRAAIAKAEGA